ncbi:hypothetical protein Ocin01_19552 [Orchesella cincta]|uniref:Uncharacterized protein n=1 Tax=Orchesella cincta TaxID=48709 RepID=A0A1D2M2E3_ORCCI|nr:hypothetical protein Ocin01_19552 [Orchesella cincta]
MDCGADLETISAALQPKDWEDRRQCRGSVGYPCKTLPLAPGKIMSLAYLNIAIWRKILVRIDRRFFRRRSGAMAHLMEHWLILSG